MLFYFIILLIFVSIGSIAFIYYRVHGRNSSDEIRGNEVGYSMILFIVLTTIVFIISSLVLSSKNTYNLEDLQKVRKYEQILTEKADVLTTQFTNYLAEIYPNLEKGIFDKISPQNISIYLVKYPELKSSETVRKLVDEISKLQDAVYEQKLKEAEIQRDIDYYHKNPWILFRL